MLLQKSHSLTVQKAYKAIDWNLLLFLVLFLNVKLYIKAVAIGLICLGGLRFRLGFRLRDSRLPLFYPVIMAIGIFNWLIRFGFTSAPYTIAVFAGIGFWLAALLAIHHVKQAVDTQRPEVLHRTIVVFLLLNACISVVTLLWIIIQTGAVNPYLYQGAFQKYFIGTGDYIKGITFDTSTTNAVLNAMGVIYFISRKDTAMTVVCMAVLLLTGSNLTNLMLGALLLLLFIFRSDRDKKSLIAICFLLLVIFEARVSPQNNTYVANLIGKHLGLPGPTSPSGAALPVWLRPDSTLSAADRRRKIAVRYLDSLHAIKMKLPPTPIAASAVYKDRPVIPLPDINSASYQHLQLLTPQEEKLKQFIASHKEDLPLSYGSKVPEGLPGKWIAARQTLHFFMENPLKMITGAGTGNFSSKLAFKATALHIAGGYPRQWAYISNDFLRNHLDLYLYFFTKDDGVHSVINNPNSVYDQLLGEYGLAGLLAFFVFYIGFFIKKINKSSYGIPLLLLLLGIFCVDYWFEQLSVVVFFELLMLLHIKEEASP